MTISPNTEFYGKTKIKLNDKEFPLVRTTTKMAFYLDGDKEKRISLSKLNDTKSEEKHKLLKKKKIEPVKRLGLHGGHMPDAPSDCSHPKKFFDNISETNWIDINICNMLKCNTKCARYNEYRKGMSKVR